MQVQQRHQLEIKLCCLPWDVGYVSQHVQGTSKGYFSCIYISEGLRILLGKKIREHSTHSLFKERTMGRFAKEGSFWLCLLYFGQVNRVSN